MAYVLEKVSVDAFYGNILLGVFKILERNPRITDIRLERQQACTPSEITNWEQTNCIRMPDDLRNFYLASNGFKFVWSYSFGQETLPLGCISICPLQELILLTGYEIRSSAQIALVERTYQLQLGAESKILQLARVDDESRVCLVYLNTRSSPTIWLADENLRWHYLANRFRQYFQMAVVHLGLPYWQFCFSPQGVPPWVEQMFFMEAPHLLKEQPCERAATTSSDIPNHLEAHVNHIDATVFRPRQRANRIQETAKYRKKNA